MKTSSLFILLGLGAVGAAGVYVATRDPSKDLVDDPRGQRVDGQGGALTKGELCGQIRADIPATEQRLNDEIQALASYEGWARKLAQAYRGEVYGGDKAKNRQREAEMVAHIMQGAPLSLGPAPGKSVSGSLQAGIDEARVRVSAFKSAIASLEKRVAQLKADELGLMSEGAC